MEREACWRGPLPPTRGTGVREREEWRRWKERGVVEGPGLYLHIKGDSIPDSFCDGKALSSGYPRHNVLASIFCFQWNKKWTI